MLIRLNDFSVQNVSPNECVTFSAKLTELPTTDSKSILGSVKIIINETLDYDIMNFIISNKKEIIPELGSSPEQAWLTTELFKKNIDLFSDILWGAARTLAQIYFNDMKSGQQTFDAPAQVTNFINGKLQLPDKQFIINAFNQYELYRKEKNTIYE